MKKIYLLVIAFILLVSTAIADEWTCVNCENSAGGNFCSNCGSAKPQEATIPADDTWVCEKCNLSVMGNFCSSCGSAKPVVSDSGVDTSEAQVSTLPEDEERKYVIAVEYQDTANWTKAIELFAVLGDFKDSPVRLLECVEKQANLYFETEEYSAAQELLLQYPSETTDALLAQCNDHCFVLDLQRALAARWARANEDTTLMSDKKLKEYYASLVSDEMKYVGKYNNLSFSDAVLAEYAYGYISALQNQWIGITEYFSVDQNLYKEYWTYQGTFKREQMIYWINRKYGLELSAEHKDALKQFVVEGQLIDAWYTTEEMLVKQLFGLQYSMKTDKYGSPEFVPTSIKNRTNYPIYYLAIHMNFHNARGEIVESTYLFSDNDINTGSNISFSDVYIDSDTEFSSVSISYEFNVQIGDLWSGVIEGTVVPQIQYSLNKGVMRKNGELAEGQATFELLNVTAKWETNQFTSKKLYVPTLKFSVKNTGNTAADRVTVRCTFINQDTHEIWSEETEYLVGSSDSALMPDYSKKAIIYSSIGYNSKPTNVPNLLAEIYVNDVLIKTVNIKP